MEIEPDQYNYAEANAEFIESTFRQINAENDDFSHEQEIQFDGDNKPTLTNNFFKRKGVYMFFVQHEVQFTLE